MENSEIVDQRRRTIDSFFAAHGAGLSAQGVVVASFRRRGERRLGPYYRLACRVDNRQVSVYLGNDQDFVEIVRRRLADLQADHREQRRSAVRRAALRRHAREARRTLDVELTALGLTRQGHEIRGWRTLKTAPLEGADSGRIQIKHGVE